MTASILDVVRTFAGDNVAGRVPARLGNVDGLPGRLGVSPLSFAGIEMWHDAQYIPIDDEPVAGYRLIDRSSNTNHGKLQTGRAMTFDGVADYIRIPNFDPAGGSGQYLSAFCWVKGASQDVRRFFSHFDSGATQRSWAMAFVGGADSKLQIYLSDDGSFDAGHRKQYVSAKIIGDDEWHRVGFTWNAGTLTLYVDGLPEASATVIYDDVFTAVHPSTADLTIGCMLNSDAWANGIAGEIADPILCDAAWSDADVAFDYNNPEKLVTERAGTTVAAANIKSWHSMIEGADTTAHYIYDNSSNGNDGVNVAGGALFIDAQETIPQMAMMGWTLKAMDSVDVYLPERPARDGKDVDGTALTQPRAAQILNMDEAGHVYVADHASIQNVFDGGGTVMAWIKPATMGGANTARVTEKTNWLCYIFSLSGGTCYINFNHLFSGAAGQWATTSRDITLGSWNLVTVTYDSDAVGNNPIIYVNGIANGTSEAQAPVGTRTSDIGENLYTGDRSAGDRPFDGPIDELSLYSSILSATQVLNYYNANKARYGL